MLDNIRSPPNPWGINLSTELREHFLYFVFGILSLVIIHTSILCMHNLNLPKLLHFDTIFTMEKSCKKRGRKKVKK